MATHAQFAAVSPARARATFASKRRNGACPSRRYISSISRARRRIVPPRPPRARELDADPTRPQSIAAVSVRATATAKKPTAIAAGGDYALELEIATDAVRMASTQCEVQGQLMRQDEQAVTKDDKSLVTLADYAAQVRALTVARIPSLVARALGRWSLFYSYSRH